MLIRVTYDGNVYEIDKLGPADFVAFERAYKVSAAVFDADDEKDVRFEWVCFLVYRGLKKLGVLNADDAVGGLTPAGLSEAFLDRIEDMEMEDDEQEDDGEKSGEAEDPSVPAAPHG